MRRTTRILIWIISILVIVVFIIYPKIKNGGRKPLQIPGGAAQAASIVKVRVVNPEKLTEVIKTSGSLISDEEVDLSFEVPGKITGIYFKEGTRVKKRDLLAKLNDLDLQAQFQKLKIQEKLAMEKEERERTLLEREAVSRESYDQVKTALLEIQSEIEIIKVQISKTEIHAPFDGIIGLRFVSEGAYVNQNAVIAKLIKNKPLKIDFSVPERYSGMIHPGTNLTFNVENSEIKYSASVYAIEPKVDPKTRTIAVRALYDNSDEELQPGRYINVELIIREINNALKIPTQALIPELGGEKVFVVRNSKAYSVAVVSGLRTDENIEIIKGLNAGDTVVTNGVMQLRNDMGVFIENKNEL